MLTVAEDVEVNAEAKSFAVLTHFATMCVLYFRQLGAIVPPLIFGIS
jgi:hypothetical protein